MAFDSWSSQVILQGAGHSYAPPHLADVSLLSDGLAEPLCLWWVWWVHQRAIFQHLLWMGAKTHGKRPWEASGLSQAVYSHSEAFFGEHLLAGSQCPKYWVTTLDRTNKTSPDCGVYRSP